MPRVSERARAWLTLLIGPLLVMVVTAVSAARMDWWWSAPAALAHGSAYRVDAAARAAIKRRSDDVVIFGSSLALRDINEAVLSRQLGVRALNLGVNALPAAGSAMYVPDIARIRPRLALLVIGPLELSDEEHPEWREKYHPGVAWEVYGPARILRHLEDHLGGLLGWLHPLHRHRVGLRRYLERGPYDLPHPRRQAHMPEPVLAPKLDEIGQRFAGRTFRGEGPNARALQAMQRRLEQAGVPLVISPAPCHPRLCEPPFPATLTAPLSALEASLGLDVLPAAALGDYSAERDFVDPLHLSLGAQRRYTLAVAAQLAERLD